jgi:hypothetical protein
MGKRKSQSMPKTTMGRVLRSNTQQEQQPQLFLVAQAYLATMREMSAPSLEAQTNKYQVSQFRLLMQTVHL